jgi:hypothetical protein
MQWAENHLFGFKDIGSYQTDSKDDAKVHE